MHNPKICMSGISKTENTVRLLAMNPPSVFLFLIRVSFPRERGFTAYGGLMGRLHPKGVPF